MVKVNCHNCKKEFDTYSCWLKRGRGKFCSKDCKARFEMTGLVSSYQSVHLWLRRKYGKAKMCQSFSCDNSSQFYDWALIKGKQYEKNVDNFYQMCRSCHRKYDSEVFINKVRDLKGRFTCSI